MDLLHVHIQQLEDKLLQLTAHCLQQKELVAKLQQENQQLKDNLAPQRTQSVQDEQKTKKKTPLKNLDYATKADFNALINHYIAQITACINFLEKIK